MADELRPDPALTTTSSINMNPDGSAMLDPQGNKIGVAKQAARAIGEFNQGINIDAGDLGGVSFGADGLTPNLTLGQGGQELQGLFGEIAGQAGGGASALTGNLTGAGGDLLNTGRGLLSDVAGFDPMAAGMSRFDRLQEALAPRRDQNRSAMESRLLAQGRLDSTTGARQLAENEAAMSREDTLLLNELFGQGQQDQRNALSDATSLIGAGANVQGGLFGELQGAAQGRRAEYDPLFQLLNASNALKGTEINRLIGSSSALQQRQQVKAMADQDGGSGTMGAIGTVVGGAAGAYFGAGNPAAISAGASVGGAAGGMMDS